MKDFLNSLLNGVFEREVSSRNKEILRNLISIKAVSQYKNKFYLNNGFVTGKIDISLNGTGFLIPFDTKFKQDLIIEGKNLNNAHFGDIVLAKILNTKKSRISAKVISILKLANETGVVYTKQIAKNIVGVNLKTGLNLTLKASQKSLKQLPIGTLLKINNTNNDIVEVLGNINDPQSDEKISLSLYNKQDKFSTECEDEALAYGDEVDPKMYPNRVNLMNLDFCTIDPFHAKDFDDAVFFDEKNMQIYVAIADVSEYVSPYSSIDSEAKKRGFSIYFPHKSIPMLPRSLSENICSLKPNVPRLTFCFKISLDSDLNVIKEELFEAIILSKKRFTYDEVDKILENDLEDPLKWIKPLFKITSNIRKKRLINAFDFHTNELRMSLDEKGQIASTTYETSTASHQLIEECMLLANKAAAKRIRKGIFRNHTPPDLKKIYNLLDNLAVLGFDFVYQSDLANLIRKIQAKADEFGNREEVDKLIIKSQKKAEYASENLGHFGLGFDRYTHFTSPIRRYSDLILHRLLKANLNKDDKFYNYLLLNISETCLNLSELEREADKVACEFMDRKFARWASENIGKVFNCYVIKNQNILIAKLDDELKGAIIFISDFNAPLLSKIQVKITQADIASAKIFGKVVR